MAMDKETRKKVKSFCAMKGIKMSMFFDYLLKENKEFNDFIEKIDKLPQEDVIETQEDKVRVVE